MGNFPCEIPALDIWKVSSPADPECKQHPPFFILLPIGLQPDGVQKPHKKMESILLSIAFYFPDFALRRASALERAACV